MKQRDALKLDDLEHPLVVSFFSTLVIKVIRKCFILYSPIIILLISSFGTLVYWGFDQLMSQHDSTATRQLKILEQQQVQDIKINLIEADVQYLKTDINELKAQQEK